MKRYFGIFNADEIKIRIMFRHSMEEDRAIKNPERCSRIIKNTRSRNGEIRNRNNLPEVFP